MSIAWFLEIGAWDLAGRNDFGINPAQIPFAALSDGQANDLGNFVGVIFEEGFFELFVKRGFRLDKKKNFFSGFFFTAPAVMGFKSGKDLNACRKPPKN